MVDDMVDGSSGRLGLTHGGGKLRKDHEQILLDEDEPPMQTRTHH